MKKAQNGVQAAIDAQKKKRDAIQAKADARKESAMAPRRAAGLPASPKKGKTTLPAGTGSMNKYMNAGTNPAGSTKVSNSSPAPKKSTGAGNKRKVVRTASAAVSAPKREMPSMSMSKPSAPGVSKGPEKKEYSKTESKIAGEIQKMKSGKNAVASQERIKALKAKDASQKMRAENKSKRMEKRAAVKAVKKSYK
jgi:hypothetical protein